MMKLFSASAVLLKTTEKGWIRRVIICNTAAGNATVVFKNGGASGTAVTTFNCPQHSSLDIDIPHLGLTADYVTLTNCHAILDIQKGTPVAGLPI